MAGILTLIILVIYFIWSSERIKKLEEKIDKLNLHFQEIEYEQNQIYKKFDNK